MNRNHLWKLLIIIFVIAWSAFEIYPPTGMSIIEVFREEGIKKDSTFSNIVERAQQLQKENPNRPLNRDWLLEVTAHREMEAFDRAIDLRITRLRRKIEIDPGHPDAIRTVRGVGYMFVPPKD